MHSGIRNFERQIELLESGFLTRQAQLEATPALSSPPETAGEEAEANAIVGVSLGFRVQVDAAAMQAALGSDWDVETLCMLNAELSSGSKKGHMLRAIFPSSDSVGYNDFLCTLHETIAPFLENGCLTLKVRVNAETSTGSL